MTPLKVLDLNDWELSAYTGETLEIQMPGFALIEPKALILGEQALATHRRSPLSAHHAYWHRLDASPIRSRNRNVRTSADLVFNQLAQMIEKGDADQARVVLAVPSHYSKDQLALMLGIVEQTSVIALALVDASVAAATTHPADWLLDVSLHQMTLTRIERQAGQLKRTSVESIPEGGLLPVIDAWLTRIEDQFVRETRFNPMRIADTEQQLWSRLYDWICGKAEPQGNGLHLEVKHQSGNWHVNFDIRELEQVSQGLAESVVALIGDLSGARLAATSRAARLPALIQGLQAASLECHLLQEDALIQGIANNADLFDRPGEDGVKFVTSLDICQEAPASPAVEPKAPQARPAATHLLHQGVARHIAAMTDLSEIAPELPANRYQATPAPQGIEVFRDNERLHTLACDDGVTIEGVELLAIRIANHGA